jgi:alpha-1,3-rhamnosyl/mannosyltransferase
MAAVLADRQGSSVSVPCYDRLPPARRDELLSLGVPITANWASSRYDYLDSLSQRQGRLVAWNRIMPVVYPSWVRQLLFQHGLGDANVYHAIFACRGGVRRGVTVGTIHDAIPLLHAEGSSLARSRFVEMVDDHRTWAERVIVPSEATRRDLVDHLSFPGDRLRVVYHGIDHKTFHPHVALPQRLLAKHGLRPGRYLLYVGAIEGRKNIDRMVEAYLRAVDADDVPLVLTGTVVGEIPRLKAALGDGTGRVRHIGYVGDQDLPGLYRGAMALVHVAIAEGFGFTPPEAMACSTPVITSKQTATGEVVGQAGLLVDAYSVDEISSAIGAILSNPALRDDLSARGVVRAREFTWKRCAEQTLEVYEDALRSSLMRQAAA